MTHDRNQISYWIQVASGLAIIYLTGVIVHDRSTPPRPNWSDGIVILPGIFTLYIIARPFRGIRFPDRFIVAVPLVSLYCLEFSHYWSPGRILSTQHQARLLIVGLAAIGGALVISMISHVISVYSASRRKTSCIPECCNCGYNLTGLLSRRCPECGTPFCLVDDSDAKE